MNCVKNQIKNQFFIPAGCLTEPAHSQAPCGIQRTTVHIFNCSISNVEGSAMTRPFGEINKRIQQY